MCINQSKTESLSHVRHFLLQIGSSNVLQIKNVQLERMKMNGDSLLELNLLSFNINDNQNINYFLF